MERVQFSEADLLASGQHCSQLVEAAITQEPALRQMAEEQGIERLKQGMVMQTMMLIRMLNEAYATDKERFIQMSNDLLTEVDVLGVPAVSLLFSRFPGVHILRDPTNNKFCAVYLHPTDPYPDPITQPNSPTDSEMNC